MSKSNSNETIQKVINTLNLSAADAEMLIHDVNNLRGHEWLEAIENLGDAELLASFKSAINYQEDEEYDDYPTEEKYFVYDKNDDCVSDGFQYEDGAIAFANSCGYPIVKVHRYYRDPTRGYKLYPLDNPVIVWAYGKPVQNEEN